MRCTYPPVQPAIPRTGEVQRVKSTQNHDQARNPRDPERVASATKRQPDVIVDISDEARRFLESFGLP